MVRRDPYQVLCVDREVDAEALKKAFRRLAHRYHPDQNPEDPEAAKRFRELVDAYGLLSDPQKRRAYDAHGGPWKLEERSGAVDLARGVKEFVGGVLGEILGARKNKRGKDLNYTLEVSFEEAMLGCGRNISFLSPVICPDCKGLGGAPGVYGSTVVCVECGGSGRLKVGPSLLGTTKTCHHCEGTGRLIQKPCQRCLGKGTISQKRHFSVKLPPGTKDKALRVVPGKGAPGIGGADSGDLQIHIRVFPHPILERDGEDLLCELPLSLMEASTGTVLGVPTLEGVVQVRIPAGSQTGRVLKLPRKGVFKASGGRGDLFVKLYVEVPQNLTRDQKDSMERLSTSMGPKQLPRRFDFQAKVDKLSKDQNER